MRYGFCGLRSDSREELELLFAGAQDLLGGGAARLREGGGRRRWRERLAEAISGRGRTEFTDLLDEPALDQEDRSWLEETREALVARGRDVLALTRCQHEPGPGGYVALAVFDESSTREAREGDAVMVGFSAYRSAAGQLTIQPRIYRVVCTNGVVLPVGTEADVASRAGSVRAAVDSCLSAVRFEREFRIVADAAAMRLESPDLLLAEVRDVPVRAGARREWDRAGDRTVWGAVNALTASARTEAHFGRRLELERLAGAFLVAYARQPRERSAGTLSLQTS